jgi:tRNA threonylcarbamoyladenosine modification (KEOPS) complex  Pcc1 subunit
MRSTLYCFRGFKNIISRTDNAIVLNGNAEDVTTIKSRVDTWLQKLERRDVADIDNEPG